MKISALSHLGDLLRERIKRPRIAAIYFLLRDDEIVYIGQSCDIENRIELHYSCRDSRNRYYKDFDRAVWMAISIDELDAVVCALIRALRPTYNEGAPAYRGGDNKILVRFGLTPHDDEKQAARDFAASLPGRAARAENGRRSATQRWARRKHEAALSKGDRRSA